MSLKNFVGREMGLLSKQHSIIPDKYLIINNRKLYHLLLPREFSFPQQSIVYRDSKIRLFALSTAILSSDAR